MTAPDVGLLMPYRGHGTDVVVIFGVWCPACDLAHHIRQDADYWAAQDPPRDVWTWNGSHDKPTFRASIGTHYGPDGKKPKSGYYCHSFITDGRWQYLGDSKHDMAGQTVPMVPYPSDRHPGGQQKEDHPR